MLVFVVLCKDYHAPEIQFGTMKSIFAFAALLLAVFACSALAQLNPFDEPTTGDSSVYTSQTTDSDDTTLSTPSSFKYGKDFAFVGFQDVESTITTTNADSSSAQMISAAAAAPFALLAMVMAMFF